MFSGSGLDIETLNIISKTHFVKTKFDKLGFILIRVLLWKDLVKRIEKELQNDRKYLQTTYQMNDYYVD